MLLGHLGVEVKRQLDGRLKIDTVDPRPVRADYELVRRMRASFCVLGPLLARRGRAIVSLPGGCNIGDRPVDLHLRGLAALGAELRIEHGYVLARAARLRGARVHLSGPRGPTVTGTANVLCAAVLARGHTVITGAALEPEIVDLGRFLIAMARKSKASARLRWRSKGNASWAAPVIGLFRIGSKPPRCCSPLRLPAAARPSAVRRPSI